MAAQTVIQQTAHRRREAERGCKSGNRNNVRIFPLFGTKWLATQEPKDIVTNRLLTVGHVLYNQYSRGRNSRQIGFLPRLYGITDETFSHRAAGMGPNWDQIATDLFQRV